MRKKHPLVLGTLSLFFILAIVPQGHNGLAQQAEEISFADVLTLPVTQSSQVVGSSRLVRSNNGVSFTLRTSKLVIGNAYSLWWIINDDEGVIFVSATGGVAQCTGEARFAAQLLVSRIPPANGKTIVAGGGFLFDTPRTAPIQIVIRDHGPAILNPMPGLVDEQISTVEGGCNVNMCTDFQIARHIPRT